MYVNINAFYLFYYLNLRYLRQDIGLNCVFTCKMHLSVYNKPTQVDFYSLALNERMLVTLLAYPQVGFTWSVRHHARSEVGRTVTASPDRDTRRRMLSACQGGMLTLSHRSVISL